tara:strand:- start:5978 stop:6184 length:207 start_codon:yes stop_codon:yes gene_type:complete
VLITLGSGLGPISTAMCPKTVIAKHRTITVATFGRQSKQAVYHTASMGESLRVCVHPPFSWDVRWKHQ